MSNSITVDFNHFDAIADQLGEKTTPALVLGGETIRKAASTNAAEDTGALKASFYVVTSEKSGYSDAVSAAQSCNPNVELAEEVEKPLPGTVLVASAVGYAPDQEYGTRDIPAHPAITPASEASAQGIFDALSRVFDQ